MNQHQTAKVDAADDDGGGDDLQMSIVFRTNNRVVVTVTRD